MSRYETLKATPPNIDELESMAEDKTSWRIRILAIDELRKWNCKRSRNILFKLAESDAVREVKIQAMMALEVFGENVDYGSVSNPDMEEYRHRANRIFKKLDVAEDGFEAAQAMQLLKNQDPELYDILDYYQGDKFEEWASQIYGDIMEKREHRK